MIKGIYSKYFQKSKSFLYPALGIKKNSKFSPRNTYIALEGIYEPEDIVFICVFDKQESEGFIEFENDMLIKNPLFIRKLSTDKLNLYFFDYEIYMEDWFNFMLGRYSKLSNVLKRAIKTYYGEKSLEYQQHIHIYLHPEEHFVEYANLLEVEVDMLKKIGELCNPYDPEKETLKISKEYLVTLEK